MSNINLPADINLSAALDAMIALNKATAALSAALIAEVDLQTPAVTGTSQRQIKVDGRWVNDGPKRTYTKPATPKTAKKPAKRTAVQNTPKKGDLVWDGTKKGRKAWNDTLSALARTSGLRNPHTGTTLYRLLHDAWKDVQVCRKHGDTPNEVIALFAGACGYVKP